MYDYLLYFLIFSFLGWCTEVVFYIFKTGRLVNRGLAKGPICPIYGVGICTSYFLLGSVENFLLLSLLSMAIATIVEFSVGFLFDKMLGQRLWNYADEVGNLHGYVCPRFSLIWGVISALVIKLIPRLDPLIAAMQTPYGRGLVFILSVIAVVDIKNELAKKGRGKNKI